MFAGKSEKWAPVNNDLEFNNTFEMDSDLDLKNMLNRTNEKPTPWLVWTENEIFTVIEE